MLSLPSKLQDIDVTYLSSTDKRMKVWFSRLFSLLCGNCQSIRRLKTSFCYNMVSRCAALSMMLAARADQSWAWEWNEKHFFSPFKSTMKLGCCQKPIDISSCSLNLNTDWRWEDTKLQTWCIEYLLHNNTRSRFGYRNHEWKSMKNTKSVGNINKVSGNFSFNGRSSSLLQASSFPVSQFLWSCCSA